MTREEAIRFLENMSIYQQPDSDYRNALDMAIKALEQEPCEGCDYKEWLKGEVEPKTDVLDKVRAKDRCTRQDKSRDSSP